MDGLLTAVVLLVVATAALFTVRSGRRRRAPTGPTHAAVAAVVVAMLALGMGALLGSTPAQATVGAVALGASVLAWAPVARSWATRGLVAWALAVDAGLLYLVTMAAWTATAGIGVAGVVGGLVLLLVEAFVLLIGASYLWELVDVLARRTWSGHADVSGPVPAGPRPFVSIHVPTHNEPPDLVIATVESLLRSEYDDLEVVIVDNNTDDPALWGPVARWFARRDRVRFLHLADWPGYKSGALNEALRVSDPRAEVIGVVDADYLVEPDFLARTAPLFADPEVAFVQTPQDYRDWESAPYFRRLYHSYGYFFDVSQRSRNERNGAIFGGTMGLVRRSALEAAGGWDEWCITEDAELSLRLLRAGGRGIHVDQTFGRGIMPLTFEALKRQRFRWCFGGIQILRLHWRSLLPGRRTDDNRLTLAQRWAYLAGGVQWFGDLAAMAFTGFLLLGSADAVLGSGVVVRRLSGLLLACLLVLVVLGAVRSLALLRRTSGATWRESVGALGLWLALGPTVALASFRGLLAREGMFLRTPKVRRELDWRDAVRGNRAELVLGVGCLGIAAVVALAEVDPGALAVAVLLAVQGGGFLAAPVNSLAAIRSDLSDEMRRRRRQLVLPSWGVPTARRGGTLAAALVGAAAALVLAAAPLAGPVLQSPVDPPAAGEREAARSAAPSAPPATEPHPTPSVAGSATAAAAEPRTAQPSDRTAVDPSGDPPAAPPTTPPAAPSSPAAPSTTAPEPGAAATTPTQRATPSRRPTDVPSGRPTDPGPR